MRSMNEDLDEIQIKCTKLCSLLNDRQVGLYSWNMLLTQSLKDLSDFLADIGVPRKEGK